MEASRCSSGFIRALVAWGEGGSELETLAIQSHGFSVSRLVHTKVLLLSVREDNGESPEVLRNSLPAFTSMYSDRGF